MPIMNTLRLPTAGFLIAAGPVAGQTLPDNYAEPVMLVLLSDDAKMEVSLRLARFPASGTGTVWLHIATADGAWSLADESFDLDVRGAAPVVKESVSFAASLGAQSVNFSATQRHSGLMKSKATGSFLVTATRHPEYVTGDIPVTLDLDFAAHSGGYRNVGRWELTGSVRGTVTIGNYSYYMVADGKWHEQTGPRARFAPAFRYLRSL